jgi:methionine sulfoxide reductase catalytic subunit
MAREPKPSEITSESVYLRRREILKQSALFVGAAAAWGAGLVALSGRGSADAPTPPPLPPEGGGNWQSIRRPSKFDTSETQNTFEDITTYNNFYELGLSKSAPAKLAHHMKPRPWTVRIEGEVEKPTTVDVDELIAGFELEERIYRMRCVEAWSMVIPWVGFPLEALVRRVNPTSRAKYVAFETLVDTEQFPGQNDDVLPWPYREGLRIDEAVNALPIIAVGVYGRPLVGQNGAPLRLVVPWKYGFKGAKSIVAIRFVEERPLNTWNAVAPGEYGFYANVNPTVDHPRWSQKTERRLPNDRIATQMFNGYGEEVASLYAGMDLQVYF